MTTAMEMQERIPVVAWDRPIKVTVGAGEWYACRICIAERGLAASRFDESGYVYGAHDEAVEHLREEHGVIE